MQVGAIEFGPSEVGTLEIRPSEVGTLELDHSEVSFLQVSLNKIDSSEVRDYFRVLLSPLVPFLDRFLKKRDMFLRMCICC